MQDFIIKYWLEILFGLIVSGLTFMVKNYVKMAKQSQERHEADLIKTIEDKFTEQQEEVKSELKTFQGKLDNQRVEMQSQMSACYANLVQVVDKRENHLLDEDKSIRSDINGLQEDINAVKGGMLTIQGKAFKDECHRLLEPTHTISLTEYDNIVSEHLTYNRLGGNHEGDALFAMVETKFKNQLAQK